MPEAPIPAARAALAQAKLKPRISAGDSSMAVVIQVTSRETGTR
jgi:hypothetical protein